MSRINLDVWIRQEQGKHFCQCGCGEEIVIQRHHHARGIPNYINHHNVRVSNPITYRSGDKNPNFKGGRRIDDKGYVLVLNPGRGKEAGRYVFEHRLIMEQSLGRKLATDEQVHHKNAIKTDNRIENLEILKIADHAALHDRVLRERLGYERYLAARRCISRGERYRELISCSE